MPLATLLPSAVRRCLLAAGNLLSQMPLQCRCLVTGLLACQSVFGNVNLCVLRLLVRLACRKVCFLQDTCMANLSWLCRFSGPSHFTKTCGHWQVVGVSTRVLTRSPAALCTVGGSLG